jgi:hypothetical protein
MLLKVAAATAIALTFSVACARAQGYPTIDNASIQQAIQILSTAQQTVGQLDNINGVLSMVQKAIGTTGLPIDVSKWTGQLSQLRAIKTLPDVPMGDDITVNAKAIQGHFYSNSQAPTRDEIETLKQRRMRALQRASLNAYQIAASATKMMETSAQDLADLEGLANGATQLMADTDVQTKALLVMIARQNTQQMLQAATLELAAAQAIAADSTYTLLTIP